MSMSMNIQDLRNELSKVAKRDITSGTSDAALKKLKLALIDDYSASGSGSGSGEDGSKKQKEYVKLARDVYEEAALLSLKKKDTEELEKHLVLLRPYALESHYRKLIGDSERRTELIALELLNLLVGNRLAELHSLLELLSEDERQDQYVAFVIGLERFLMEGAFNKVLAARSDSPSTLFDWLLEELEVTVREEVASSMEAAYESISLEKAAKLMKLSTSSVKEVKAYAAEKEHWEVQDGKIWFKPEEKTSGKDLIPSNSLMQETLHYASELERIV